MQPNDFLFFNFKHFFQDILVLAEEIKAKHPQTFDYVIAINRGGSVLGRFLSDLLQVPMGAFAMASYEGIDLRKELKITQKLNLDLKDKKILLVDEICDTGNTFIKAVEYLKDFQPASVLTASLVIKPHTQYSPDFWVEKTDKWVVFPYEVRETIQATKNQPAEVKAAIEQFFTELGVKQDVLQSML